ncbi:shikimate kinase [Bacillus kexueae]|uniref:shikimate kinase n=1 Tax=Aeribacillus kexueae TaxID=2078952 RepID=UPI001FAE8481
MKTIYLVGFMGSGKTTIGRMLAESLNIPVVDTDEEIVQKVQMDIPAIFEKYGEEYFRDVEGSCLRSIPTQNFIVTTGGGIITRDENIQWMREQGLVIYLKADVSVLVKRIQNDANRPLANNKSIEEIRELHEKRKSQYEKAHLVIDTTDRTTKEVLEKVLTCIKEKSSGDTNS